MEGGLIPQYELQNMILEGQISEPERVVRITPEQKAKADAAISLADAYLRYDKATNDYLNTIHGSLEECWASETELQTAAANYAAVCVKETP